MQRFARISRRQCAAFRMSVLAALLAAYGSEPAAAQDQAAPDGMIIKRIEVRGLDAISEGFILRMIKTREEQNLSNRQLRQDVRELLRSRKFVNVFAETRVEDGRAVVVIHVQEKPEIRTVEIEGNKRFTDVELFDFTPASGQVIDMYEINRGTEDILRKYQEAGYYYATVELDDALLRAEGRVLYRIIEGPRVKVREILYEGNRSFLPRRLKMKVSTRRYIWILRTGEFDEQRAERDAFELQRFYREQGYLDARVGYRLEFDEADRTDLTMVFVIEEGARYRIDRIEFEGNTAFDADRLRSELKLQPGGFVLKEALDLDVRRVTDLYGEIGYVDARIGTRIDFLEEPGVVVLRFSIVENKRSRFGRIHVRGNVKTKDAVVRRELRFYPGEDFNTVAVRRAERRLLETQLFSEATITPLEDVNGLRDAVVDVVEADVISFLIGGAISTDAGVIGTITLENRSFDLFAWPRSWGDLFRGRAFRGAGQRIRIQLEPGSQVSRFRIDFDEPFLADRPLRLGTSVYLFQRQRNAYDEQRLGFAFSLGKRFETGLLEGWAIEGALRVEGVDIDNLSTFPAKDIRDAKGTHTLTTLKGTIVRDTTDSILIPSEGYRLTLGWEQYGAFGGDFSFSHASASATWYRTLRTDIFDRKSVLAVRGDIGANFGDTPVFERFYAGGFGSIRGFDFRGVSPRAGVFDNAVGGDFILLTGAEYSYPLYAKTLRGVVFVDMGTVEEDFEITDWRASVGFGFRLTVGFFGPIPFVFDFGWPIAQAEDDSTRVFNFSVGASFY